MAPRYFPVSPKFWLKGGARGWTDDEQKMALYLLTSPHRITEGLYSLPREYMERDLEWDAERTARVLRTLIEDRGFAKYDDDAEVVFVAKALRYQPPKGHKSITGALSSLESVPPTYLIGDLIAAARELAPEFATALEKHHPAPPEAPSKPLPEHGAGSPIEGASGVGVPNSAPTQAPTQAQEQQPGARTKLNEVVEILTATAMLVEPGSIDSAIQAHPTKDAVAAAHIVAAKHAAGLLRTTNATAIFLGVLRDMPAQPNRDERDDWDEALVRAMRGDAA